MPGLKDDDISDEEFNHADNIDTDSDDDDTETYHWKYQTEPPIQVKHDDIATTTSTETYLTYLTQQGFTPTEPLDDETVELYVSQTLAHWEMSCPRQLEPDEVLVFQINKNKVSVVIKRDCNNLSPDEIRQNIDEVNIAKLDELKRWHSLNCFRRLPKSKATNVIDGTWVLKYKNVLGTGPDGKPTSRKVIKARLTARGFKDLQAYQENISTYSGTSTKAAQRLVNGHAAQNEYPIFSMDISAAFLKGMTFEEIARETGQPLRSVQFKMPADSIPLLKQLEGMHDFNPIVEVLDFLKAMWGLKDAPRAFGLRRDRVFKEFGATPTVRDPNLWYKTIRQNTTDKSVCLMSSHIDDIKGSAEPNERKQLATILRRYFGDDLKEHVHVFEFTGVKHIQNTKDHSIYCHQDHYITELSIIPLPATRNIDLDADATETQIEAFNSLLGALAWLLVTRADIAAYIGFLQRLARKPKQRHLRMINKVLQYCKRVSTGIKYTKLHHKPRLLIIADSAYQATEGEPDCIALRGYFIFLACNTDKTDTSFPGGNLQLIDFAARKLHVISRSAFAAELRNTLEALQEGINVAILFHEIYRGPFTPEQCTAVRDHAQHFLSITCCTDNYGLYSAITKDEPSAGSDASMIFHVKACRSLLDNHNITNLTWTDNRDMIADGLTKGKPSREDINHAMQQATWIPQQPHKTWSSSTKPGSQASSPPAQQYKHT